MSERHSLTVIGIETSTVKKKKNPLIVFYKSAQL